MKKAMMYQSNKEIWVIETKDYNRYFNNNDVTPLREVYIDITKQALDTLFKMSDNAPDIFQDMVKQELELWWAMHAN